MTVDGLTFRNFQSSRHSAGADMRGENNVVRNCRSSNCMHGLLVSGPGQHSRIEDCRIDDCGIGIKVVNTEKASQT